SHDAASRPPGGGSGTVCRLTAYSLSKEIPSMSIRFPLRLAAGSRRRASVLIAGLSCLAALLGGCSQRMALKVNGQTVTQDQFNQRCADFTQGQLQPPVGMIVLDQSIRELLMSE